MFFHELAYLTVSALPVVPLAFNTAVADHCALAASVEFLPFEGCVASRADGESFALEGRLHLGELACEEGQLLCLHLLKAPVSFLDNNLESCIRGGDLDIGVAGGVLLSAHDPLAGLACNLSAYYVAHFIELQFVLISGERRKPGKIFGHLCMGTTKVK